MSRIDRRPIRKIKIEEQANDYAWWSQQTYEARLATLESIRTEFNNWKYHDKQGFQRVYRVIKQQ